MQIIDDEPKWIAFLQRLDIRADIAIVSSRQMDKIPELKAQGCPVIVATGQPTTSEAITAYRAGAVNYIAKDFRQEIILAAIRQAEK